MYLFGEVSHFTNGRYTELWDEPRSGKCVLKGVRVHVWGGVAMDGRDAKWGAGVIWSMWMVPPIILSSSQTASPPPPPPGREFSTGVLHLQPLDILKACQDLRIQARGSLGGGETRVARGEGCCWRWTSRSWRYRIVSGKYLTVDLQCCD